jgi:hypothetical protein
MIVTVVWLGPWETIDRQPVKEQVTIWRTLLQAEDTALKEASRTKAKCNGHLIGNRLLGFFLKDHAHDGYLGSTPNLGSTLYNCMVVEITSCLSKSGNKAIHDTPVELGLMYRNYILRVCELHEHLPW